MKQSSTKLVPVAVYLLIVTSCRYSALATESTEFSVDDDGPGLSNETVKTVTKVKESQEYVMPLLLKVTWWTLYVPTAVFGCLGNTAVVWTELRNPISKSGSRCLLVQMCVLDAITSILLRFPNFVQTVTENWLFGPVFCYIMHIMYSAPVLTSMLSIAALALERFRCFIRPGKLPMTSWFVWTLIAAMWIFSVSLSLLDVRFPKIIKFSGRNISACLTKWPVGVHNQRIIFDIAFEVSLHIILVLVPVILIGYVYVRLALLQWRSRATEQDILSSLPENQKIFILTDVLVFGFAACELPFRILQALRLILESYLHVNINVYLLLHWLVSCKAVICPIVYFSLYKRNNDEIQQTNGSKRDSGRNVQRENGNEEFSTSTI